MEELVTLVNRAQSGDTEAYGVLVSRFQDMAYGYAYAFLSDFDLAQDAAQEAFIEAYQCLPTLREAYAFPAWLKRIVHKHCDRLTRRKRVPIASLDTAVDLACSRPGPADIAESRDLAQRVREAISGLPDQQRVVTTLFYINGYSHNDIAEFLEVPAKTVKSRLHASRTRLRERMIDMVEDELKSNKLPEEFARETVEQAVARASELNKKGKHNEAEELLRQILPQAPGNSDVLKEFNRALMQGRVYGQSRFDMLPEVAEYGRMILRTVDNDDFRRQLAKTLLAIPAMHEAVVFVQEWIAKEGPNLERLGMLAWAKGCAGDYGGSEADWQDVLTLAQGAQPHEVRRHVPFVAKTLVDCFAGAGDLPRAQRIALQAWERCHGLSPILSISQIDLIGDAEWIGVFHQAKLDWREIAGVLLERHRGNLDPQAQAIALCIRGWVEDPESVLRGWLDWVRARIAASQLAVMERCRYLVNTGLVARGAWRVAEQVARDTCELLHQAHSQEANKLCSDWAWVISHPYGVIEAGDWDEAERIARERIEERGMRDGGWALILTAAARGVPTPLDVVHAVEREGVHGADDYGMYGWHMVAREFAAAGDEARAFEALRNALSYWMNPPYAHTEIWENDARWGELRNRPEFKAAFEEKRKRIGPVHGHLFYFPGW